MTVPPGSAPSSETHANATLIALTLSGSLDQYSPEALKQQILPLLEEQGNRLTLTLSLRDVTHIETSALQVLIAADMSLKEKGCRLILADAGEETRLWFRVAGAEALLMLP